RVSLPLTANANIRETARAKKIRNRLRSEECKVRPLKKVPTTLQDSPAPGIKVRRAQGEPSSGGQQLVDIVDELDRILDMFNNIHHRESAEATGFVIGHVKAAVLDAGPELFRCDGRRFSPRVTTLYTEARLRGRA